MSKTQKEQNNLGVERYQRPLFSVFVFQIRWRVFGKRRPKDLRLKNNLFVERHQRLISLVFVFQTSIVGFRKQRPKTNDADLAQRLSSFWVLDRSLVFVFQNTHHRIWKTNTVDRRRRHRSTPKLFLSLRSLVFGFRSLVLCFQTSRYRDVSLSLEPVRGIKIQVRSWSDQELLHSHLSWSVVFISNLFKTTRCLTIITNLLVFLLNLLVTLQFSRYILAAK